MVEVESPPGGETPEAVAVVAVATKVVKVVAEVMTSVARQECHPVVVVDQDSSTQK